NSRSTVIVSSSRSHLASVTASRIAPSKIASAEWPFNCSISVIAGSEGIALRLLAIADAPIDHALLPYIAKAHEHDADVDQHLPEAEPAVVAQQVLVDNRPGDQEDRFHVEQDEEHRDEIELHREAVLRVSRRRDAAFIRLHLHAAVFALPQ